MDDTSKRKQHVRFPAERLMDGDSDFTMEELSDMLDEFELARDITDSQNTWDECSRWLERIKFLMAKNLN